VLQECVLFEHLNISGTKMECVGHLPQALIMSGRNDHSQEMYINLKKSSQYGVNLKRTTNYKRSDRDNCLLPD
jgi:hypothetical protein